MTDPFKTTHHICIGDSSSMSEIEDRSIDLVLTSPPYPMIQMWDDQFSRNDPIIEAALADNNGVLAFEQMHRQLDPVWDEAYRLLRPGGIACVNIGDATRTLKTRFQLFPNHARIITKFLEIGFSQLPTIIWRKPTNAPNKFMGSGMLPPGAYVTLEHEYILIFRKGQKRPFEDNDKAIRRSSAYFWEERNAWFSDVWFDLRGASQKTVGRDSRKRGAAFPLELPFRLINMFSVQGDTVVDPFLGSGTTMVAAMCAGRNTIGYEIEKEMQPGILARVGEVPDIANQIIRDRLDAHIEFVRERKKARGVLKHTSRHYGFPVMTRQEEDIRFLSVNNVQYRSDLKFSLEYGDLVQREIDKVKTPSASRSMDDHNPPPRGRQMKLF